MKNWQVHLAGNNNTRARLAFIADAAEAGAGRVSDDGDNRLGFQEKLRADTGVKLDVPLVELDDFFRTEILWDIGEQFVLEITLNEYPTSVQNSDAAESYCTHAQ